MSRLEIGSMVRVRDEDDSQGLVGKIGKVVAYLTRGENVVVQFEGMELHSASVGSDRPLDGRRNKWFIHPKHLELVKEENKQMTKKDLKSGMTVKLRNGDVCLVINDFITDANSFMYFKDFTDNLVCTDGFTKLDIVEVYQFTNPVTKLHVNTLTNLLNLEKTGMKLLWKRQELPKLSSAELVILKNLDKKCKWIARDVDGGLYVFSTKPTKHSTVWQNTALTLALEAFPKLFTFVKWEDEQPYSIEELLKNC